jgi:hypothetical protein
MSATSEREEALHDGSRRRYVAGSQNNVAATIRVFGSPAMSR